MWNGRLGDISSASQLISSRSELGHPGSSLGLSFHTLAVSSPWSHGASSWGGAPARPRSESWQGSGKEAFLPPAGERARKLPAFMSLAGRVLAAGCPGGCLGASPAPQEVTAQGGCWGWKPSCLFWSRGQESDCWACPPQGDGFHGFLAFLSPSKTT